MSNTNNINKKNKQVGIALIQVLLITAVLSVLALYITQTAKNQVRQAQWVNDKAQALVNVHSAEALLYFDLLTNKRSPSSQNQSSESVEIDKVHQRWNFYSTPFTVIDNVTVKIQDQSGLIHLHFQKRGLLKKLITTFEPSSIRVEVFADSLLDWQDIDNIPRPNGIEAQGYGGINLIRNGAVPSIIDIKNINSISRPVQELLMRNATIYQTGTFSVYNAPAEILNALTDRNSVMQVMDLRRSNTISPSKFSEVTGIFEDDDTYFYTSNYIMIDLTSQVGESTVNKTIFIHLEPYAEGNKAPINTFISRG